MDPIRVGIVDDDPLTRHALSQILGRHSDIVVAWTAQSGDSALERLGDDPASSNSPATPQETDVLLMDINMPMMNGLETAKILRLRRPELPIIMLTTFERNRYLAQAIDIGAMGFLVKDASEDSLTAAVRAAHQGIGVFSPQATRRLIEQPGHLEAAEDNSPLTERELTVLRLVAQSMTNGQIARRLHVSEATVKSQISSIISKLNCTDRVGMVMWGFHNGVLR